MQAELYRFLLLQKQLHLPGIGTFRMERESADLDFAAREVRPPVYSVALHHGNGLVTRKFYQFLAGQWSVSESDAVIRFNDFLFELKQQINAGAKQHWPGIGTLSKGLAGEIRFQPDLRKSITRPVPATKVIREHAGHQVRVGEDERSSAEMIELLQVAPPRPNGSKIWIWIIILAALAFVAWYFYDQGWLGLSAGNRTRVSLAPGMITRVLLP